MAMHFIFEQIQTGGDRNFGYLVGDGKSKKAALIDPSYIPEKLVERADAQGLNVDYIINTHSHGDHTNGNAKAKELTGAKICVFAGSGIAKDIGLKDHERLFLGDLELIVFHTPGHSSDHIVLFIPRYKAAFTGDHLFVGKIGGTNTLDNAKEQYDSLGKLFDVMPEEATIWPGHDVGCRPTSTLAIEKASNPFLLAENFQAFCELKENWAAFKTRHGLM